MRTNTQSYVTSDTSDCFNILPFRSIFIRLRCIFQVSRSAVAFGLEYWKSCKSNLFWVSAEVIFHAGMQAGLRLLLMMMKMMNYCFPFQKLQDIGGITWTHNFLGYLTKLNVASKKHLRIYCKCIHLVKSESLSNFIYVYVDRLFRCFIEKWAGKC